MFYVVNVRHVCSFVSNRYNFAKQVYDGDLKDWNPLYRRNTLEAAKKYI